MEHDLERVLIVEDDAGIREALAECVASLGVEVATSSDGEEGLERIRGSRLLPDAILLDLRMPRLDGDGFLRALRANPATAEIPVVAMSACEAPHLPVHAFLEKPFDLDELAKILTRLGRERNAA